MSYFLLLCSVFIVKFFQRALSILHADISDWKFIWNFESGFEQVVENGCGAFLIDILYSAVG